MPVDREGLGQPASVLRYCAGNRQLQVTSDITVAEVDGVPDAEQKKPPRGPIGQVCTTARPRMLGAAIRVFLMTYVQRTWGLNSTGLSQTKLAALLTDRV